MDDYGLPYMLIEIVSKAKKDWRRDLENKPQENSALGIPIYLCLDPYNQEWHIFYSETSGIKSIEKIPAEGQIVAINADLAASWDGSSERHRFLLAGQAGA